jgi:hypothetical protein
MQPRPFAQGTDNDFIWPVETGSGDACTLNIEDEECIGLLSSWLQVAQEWSP